MVVLKKGRTRYRKVSTVTEPSAGRADSQNWELGGTIQGKCLKCIAYG